MEELLPIASRNKNGLLSSKDYSKAVPSVADSASKTTVYKIVGNTTGSLPRSAMLIYGSKNAVPVFIVVAMNSSTIRAEKLTQSTYSLYKDGLDIYVEVSAYSTISVLFQSPSSSNTTYQLIESEVDVSTLTKIL